MILSRQSHSFAKSMNFTNYKLFWMAILSLSFFSSCTDTPNEQEAEEPFVSSVSIVTTTTQITDLVKQLTGGHCKVHPMMGPGVDPHLYKPTARDVMSLSTADLIVFHGLQLEGKLGTAFETAGLSRDKIFSISSVIEPSALLFAEEEEGKFPDPHIWFDPTIWTTCLHGLAARLSSLLPEQKVLISEKVDQLTREFQAVHEWGAESIQRIPPSKRILITSHDAFQYFGRSFGVEVIALQGISTATEAGLADRSNLVDYLKESKVPCIFVESSVNPKALQQIGREAKVALGRALFSDALGAEDAFVFAADGKKHSLASWSGMMIYNIQSIVEGLVPSEQ